MRRGVDRKPRNLLTNPTRQRIEQLKRFNLVVKQLNPQGQFGMLCRKNINGVAANPEMPAGELNVIALVLHADQLGDQIALAQLIALANDQHHLVVVRWVADTVDAGDRGHDHRVTTLQQRLGRRQPHLFNVLVDRRVFLNKEVALRHVGLGLVVVVIGDEVLDRIRGEELPHL